MSNIIHSGIYKITSPKNRVYIGESGDVLKRRGCYERLECVRQIRLYNSIKKYGWENHTFEIIELCCFEKLKERERYWQDFYDVLGIMGMNCRLTGTNEKKYKISEITKLKISKANIGRKHSEETKKQYSIKRKGKIVSEHTKQKISIANKGRKHSLVTKSKMSLKKLTNANFSKPVYQYDLFNRFIKKWGSAKEAGTVLNITNSNINKCCRRERKTTGNFKWKYEE